MNKNVWMGTMPICLSILLAGAWLANAGSLTPPAGPITETMKDLDTVEPRTALRNDNIGFTPIVINQSGSYYLAETILSIGGQHGIEITANDVTLDLNGFAVAGNTEVGSLDGIHVNGTLQNVTVKNGVVRNFVDSGIYALLASNCQFHDLILSNNGNNGLTAGDNAIITRCTSQANGGTGISISQACVVVDCVSRDNQANGISSSAGSSIRGCVARNNGINGISTTFGCTVTDCTVFDNANIGIATGIGSTVTGCTAYTNDDDGISVTNSLVRGNTSIANGVLNIDAAGGSTLLENHAP